MGLQRITISVYGDHPTVVEEARNVVKYLGDTGKGLTAAAAYVTNHPGEPDESATDLLVAPPVPASTPEPAATSEPS